MPNKSVASPSSQPQPYLRAAQWGLLILLLAHFCGKTLPKAWRQLNTDFPNYYEAARLVHDHVDLSRAYEWTWFQREKDRLGIDQRLVTLTPITPFSTLVLYPIASLPALAAKHIWLLFNLALLLATIGILRKLTELSVLHLSLLALLSYPLRINFAFGQYYVLLLFLLTAACWLYVHQRRVLSGALIGLAAGLKIFPAIYLLYFLRKRDFKAFSAALLVALGTVAVSIAVFGWPMHHSYLSQVLPATLRGEGLDPYNLQAGSLSTLLHRLFIFEPQLNPFPAWNAPSLFAVLHPLLQMVVIVPAIWLCIPKNSNPAQLRTEYTAVLLASLAISTSPASYLFTLLILPVCLLVDELNRKKSYLSIAAVIAFYVAVGFSTAGHAGAKGWLVLLMVPRLYEVLALCGIADWLLYRRSARNRQDLIAWSLLFSGMFVFSVISNAAAQRNVYADYQRQIPLPQTIYMATGPSVSKDGAVAFTAMTMGGYRSAVLRESSLQLSSPDADDQLSLSIAGDREWVEDTGRKSTIRLTPGTAAPINDAESPVASPDNQWVAFLREDHGRNRLWIRPANSSSAKERALTPSALNVFEMSFLPDDRLIVATSEKGAPHLLRVGLDGEIDPLVTTEARYPAVSPDGQWLVYSQFDARHWNLWLRSLADGDTRRISDAACDNISATWLPDSHTIVYSSNCGRGSSFFALCKRRIVP